MEFLSFVRNMVLSPKSDDNALGVSGMLLVYSR